MCIKFCMCITFCTCIWNMMNLSSDWQKLLNRSNYTKFNFKWFYGIQWWPYNQNDVLQKIFERFRKKIRWWKIPCFNVFVKTLTREYFFEYVTSILLKKHIFRKISQEFERFWKNSKDFERKYVMNNIMIEWFSNIIWTNPCFFSFFQLAKN